MAGSGDCTTSQLALLYVGSVLPDTPEFHTPAFSRAGVMFQTNLLQGLHNAGLSPSGILSFRQIPSFPRGSLIWARSGAFVLPGGLRGELIPFLNLTPLKQVWLGCAALFRILCWGWRNKHASNKVVYVFNLTVPPGLFVLLGARLIGAKAAVSINDINIPGETVPNTPLNRLDYLLQKMTIPVFDRHIVVSDRIMQDFAPKLPYVRVEGGVTVEMLSDSPAAPRPGAGDPSRTFTIVATGSLDETNGFRVLLEAFSLLNGEHFRLVIAGAGPLSEEVRTASTQDQRITYRGLLSLQEVLALYRAGDLLLNMRLTKVLDTGYFFPSKLMEYLASGTPVLSTCTGHVESELGEIVFLLCDETAAGLAEKILQIESLDPALLAARGAQARLYMERNKTWEAQGRTVASFIRSMFPQAPERDI